MKRFARGLAAAAAIGLAGGPVFAQDAAILVRDAPIHKVPDDAAPAKADEANGPVEDNAVPDTLNAQYAAQSKIPAAALTKISDPAPAPEAAPKAEARVEGPTTPIAARIIDAAGAFEAYLRHTSAISAKFADGTSVAKAVAQGSAYETAQFQEGATAYGALVALQDPAFVQGVFDMSRDPRDRAAMTEQLIAHPETVMDVDGAEGAGAMVGAVLAKMGADLVHAGQAVKQASYSVQSQAWSKEDVSHPEQRLAAAKAQSAIKVALNPADTDALIKTIVALRKTEGAAAGRGGEPTPIVQHALAVAALAVMGRAGDAQVDRIAPLLSDAKSADCMKMAKLNLYQCMAAAGPEYEDVFCLGAHAMIDTGQCLISASGQSPIPEGSVQKASAPAPATRSVSVPMALMSTDGPERVRVRSARAAAPPADRTDEQAQGREVPPAPPSAELADEDAPVRAAPPPPAPAPQRSYGLASRDYAPAPRAPAPQAPQAYDDDYAQAPRDYAQAPRRQAYPYQPAPRQDAYADGQAYDPRYADPYANRYNQPQRQAYPTYRGQPDAYADAYGPYGYGR